MTGPIALAGLLTPVLGLCTPLQSRATDAISSCGSQWMSAQGVNIAQGTDSRTGFSTAVQSFCSAAKGQTVKAGGYMSMATEVFLNGGSDPTSYGVVGFVYFEIHNKLGSDHKVDFTACKNYLLALSADGGKCSGTHQDTKGGTWQIGNDGISYHALGNEIPPRQDGLNRIYTGAVLEPQTVNKGSGPSLNPWPFNSIDNVKPTNCHSHNDYDRNIPVFSALSAGCVSIEADVFYSGGDVIIGHSSPTPGRTLYSQYVQPLRAILDYNNGGAPGNNGIYKSRPKQTFVLMVDFKTSDSGTLDAVVKALQPLRDGGYLSYVASGKFVERQITVVASGSAPFDRINTGNGVPNRDVFYDAKLDQEDSKYTSLNSYYSSTDFQATIGKPSGAASFSQAQKDKVTAQVAAAHAAGLKVRYWNLPGDYMWESLAALGDDRLNADDMYDTARLRRIM